MPARRALVRTGLALARVSNLPTVWTNVLAGMVLAEPVVRWPVWVAVAAGVSLIYCAGMVFNDTADAEFDARERADRPIPAGDISLGAARGFGLVLLTLGVLTVVGVRLGEGDVLRLAGATLLLVLAIQYYNWRHKRDPLGPLVMGLCRGVVYVVAACAVAGSVSPAVLTGAVVMAVYVTALTLVAKLGGAQYGWSIAWLIAGVSVLDAAVIGFAGRWDLALLAILGFPLTILAQRLVRGT